MVPACITVCQNILLYYVVVVVSNQLVTTVVLSVALDVGCFWCVSAYGTPEALLSAEDRIRPGGTYLMTVGGSMRVRVHLVMP